MDIIKSSKRNSSKQESIILVFRDSEQWWKKTGIGPKTTDSILVKILTDRYENSKNTRQGREKETQQKTIFRCLARYLMGWLQKC